VVLHEVADGDEVERRRGQLAAQAGKHIAESRHNHHHEEDRDANSHDGDGDRIHQGGLHLLAQAGGVFLVSGQAGKDFRQQSPFSPAPTMEK